MPENNIPEYTTERNKMVSLIRETFSCFLTECGESSFNFDVERAIYWYCSDWYNGQNDILYSILCMSEYKPSLLENNIYYNNEENYNSIMCYELLEEKRVGIII